MFEKILSNIDAEFKLQCRSLSCVDRKNGKPWIGVGERKPTGSRSPVGLGPLQIFGRACFAYPLIPYASPACSDAHALSCHSNEEPEVVVHTALKFCFRICSRKLHATPRIAKKQLQPLTRDTHWAKAV